MYRYFAKTIRTNGCFSFSTLIVVSVLGSGGWHIKLCLVHNQSTKQTNVELAWISFAQTGLSLFYGYGYFAAAKRALKVGDTSTPKLIPAYPMFQVELVYRAVPLFAVSRRLTKKRKYRRTEGLLRIKSGNANVQ